MNKKIAILGEKSEEILNFGLELAWMISFDRKTEYIVSDSTFIDFYSDNANDSVKLGEFRLSTYESSTRDASIVITDKLEEDSDFVIFVASQSVESADYFREIKEFKKDIAHAVVFLDFIDCEFSDKFFKKHYICKDLQVNSIFDEYFEFNEDVSVARMVNKLNRNINLSHFPNKRKKQMVRLMNLIGLEIDRNYKKVFKNIRKKVRVC